MISRGQVWFERLTAGGAPVGGLPPSVVAADVSLGARTVRVVAVVPDNNARFERARNGEIGIDEGYAVARAVNGAPSGSAILAVVDVPGQAFGIREEAAGLQRALAAAAEAYIGRRRGGDPVAALIVGKAISGAFLAHGMQAGWIGALRDPDVEVHVMSAAAAARVTRMSPEDIARLAQEIPATSRDIERFASLGAIDELFDVRDAAAPSADEVGRVRDTVARAIANGCAGTRRTSDLAQLVRDRIDAQWDA